MMQKSTFAVESGQKATASERQVEGRGIQHVPSWHLAANKGHVAVSWAHASEVPLTESPKPPLPLLEQKNDWA